VAHNGAVTGAALGFRDVSFAAYAIAFAGGVFSFLSPCVLPLAPGYLSMVSGLDLATLEEGGRRHWGRILATTALFITGFGTVFTLLGMSASALGGLLFEHQVTLTRVSGALMLAMAVFMAGSIFVRAPWLYRERRFHPRLGAWGKAAPLALGAAFGFGWSPCIGPTLASVNAIAASDGRAVVGATLLMTYALGLGVPFLVLGLALGRLSATLAALRRHFTGIVLVSSAVLGGFGWLLLTNNLVELSGRLTELLRDTPLEWVVELG
jgi:cytochrome c-type biogenesis protein